MQKESGKLQFGQSLTLQWVAIALTRIEKDIQNGGDKTLNLLGDVESIEVSNNLDGLALGCINTVNYILPFAIELALKALLQKHLIAFKKKHDLIYLFKLLPYEVRVQVEDLYFQKLESHKQSSELTLEEFIEQHKDDFINWRYLENAEKLKREEMKLQCLILALLGTFLEGKSFNMEGYTSQPI